MKRFLIKRDLLSFCFDVQNFEIARESETLFRHTEGFSSDCRQIMKHSLIAKTSLQCLCPDVVRNVLKWLIDWLINRLIWCESLITCLTQSCIIIFHMFKKPKGKKWNNFVFVIMGLTKSLSLTLEWGDKIRQSHRVSSHIQMRPWKILSLLVQ